MRRIGGVFKFMRRSVASWFVVGLGLLLGLIPLAFLGLVYFHTANDPAFILGLFGFAFWIVMFLSGSIAGLYSRRTAAWIFVALMPPGVYALGSQVSQAGIYEDSFPWKALGLTAALYLPLFAVLLARKSMRPAARTLVIAAAIAAAILALSMWTPGLISHIAAWSLPYLLFATFWWRTHHSQWPPLRSNYPGLPKVIVASLAVIVTLNVALTFAFSMMGSSIHGGDCGIMPMPVQPIAADRGVFTARILFTGVSLSERIRNWRFSDAAEKWDHRSGDWAIAWVEEKYGGLAPWEPVSFC